MQSFKNAKGKEILQAMVTAICENKSYLSEVDGLIGDGDHGMNMNKGFATFGSRLAGREISFSDGLQELGLVLLNEIRGFMGPIYGKIFLEMADTAEEKEEIDLLIFTNMLQSGQAALGDVVDAQVGDKTLIDTLAPAVASIQSSVKAKIPFPDALDRMKAAAREGMESTKDLAAKYGRSSRLGERSRGVLDAGAVSCSILLAAMADGIQALLREQ